MTVSELREWLANEPDDAEVLYEDYEGILHESEWVTIVNLGVVSVRCGNEWSNEDDEDD